jgi:hypothetical protein
VKEGSETALPTIYKEFAKFITEETPSIKKPVQTKLLDPKNFADS